MSNSSYIGDFCTSLNVGMQDGLNPRSNNIAATMIEIVPKGLFNYFSSH